MKILVIRLGAIGDVILTSPALLNLKLSFPDSHITLLTRPHLTSIADQIHGLDETLEFPREATWHDLFRMGEYLDRHNYDMLIDLHGNMRSFYLMKHIGASHKVRYPKRGWQRFQSVRFKKIFDPAPHTIDLYNEAVRQVGGTVYTSRPQLSLRRDIKESKYFNNDKPVIAIAPGASYPTKQWPIDRFQDLAVRLFDEHEANIILLLTESERSFESLSGKINKENLIIYIDEPLRRLPSIIKSSDILISNDSALAHIGSAVGTPVLAIFGPTHPTLGFSPRGLKDKVIEVDEKCRPCSRHGKKQCYRDRQYCFERIEVSQLIGEVSTLLAGNSKGEKALFIDRDGTLIVDKHYLFDPVHVEPEEGSFEAVKMARKAGYKIIVVSNQSGVARGFFTEQDVVNVNERILALFSENDAPIDDILYCPHYKTGRIKKYAIDCNCRKPFPGLIETACRKHNLNPFRSYVIGDKHSDIKLAYVTGGRPLLVRTGYGIGTEKELSKNSSFGPEYIGENLLDSVKYIVNADEG